MDPTKTKAASFASPTAPEVVSTAKRKAVGPVQDTHGSMLHLGREESHAVHTLNAPIGAVVIIIAAIKQGLHGIDSSYAMCATYSLDASTVSSINLIQRNAPDTSEKFSGH
ncbi:MAG: hypothetical protein MUF52_01780 [Syntrophobacteraceae bacterium]|jgi:hypothetical protein|nr:hypothetical protein [Syntrophobacteraceae bacterium]